MKKYNGYDELSDRKDKQHWAGSKKFHDDNDKRIADLEKSGKEAKKSPNFAMTKKNVTGKIKMNESQLRKVISKAIRESLEEAGYGGPKTTSVYDPIGYFVCKQNVYNSIMRNGFDPEMLGNANNQLLGKGFYFCTEVPGSNMRHFYGDKIIKVRVLGEYEAYDSREFGGKIFVVRPNDADNIEIIQDENPYGSRAGQWTTTMSSDIYESHIRKIVREALKESLNEARKQANPGEIYRTLLGIGDSMRDYAWTAVNDKGITTAIVHLNNAIKAWEQVMKDNGIR